MVTGGYLSVGLHDMRGRSFSDLVGGGGGGLITGPQLNITISLHTQSILHALISLLNGHQ